jgi:hypothetical protein
MLLADCSVDWPAAGAAVSAVVVAVGVMLRSIKQLPIERRARAGPPAYEDDDEDFDWPALDPVDPPKSKLKRAANELRR